MNAKKIKEILRCELESIFPLTDMSSHAERIAGEIESKSEEEAGKRYKEGYEFLDLDETAKLVKGHTLFETTYNNMIKALKLAAFGKGDVE